GVFETLMQESNGRPALRRPSPARSIAAVQATSETDDLTGVLTRRSFIETVTASLESRSASSPAALLVLDVDLFKRVNDAFGHLRGDDVLRSVADVLRNHVDGRGVVGRFAGDEFV